jgi:hypothetical protein
MASDKEKEKPARRDLTEAQDQSIKARKTQLFDDEPVDESLATQSFAHYLKTTPPAPLAQWFKIMLWALGVVVLLLFFAAIMSGRHSRSTQRKADSGAVVRASAEKC